MEPKFSIKYVVYRIVVKILPLYKKYSIIVQNIESFGFQKMYIIYFKAIYNSVSFIKINYYQNCLIVKKKIVICR